MRESVLVEIRRVNFLFLSEKYKDRATFAKKLGYSDANYVNQIAAGYVNLGARTRTKIEKVEKLPNGWLCEPHPNLWSRIWGDSWQDGMREKGINPDEFTGQHCEAMQAKVLEISEMTNNQLATMLEQVAKRLRRKK